VTAETGQGKTNHLSNGVCGGLLNTEKPQNPEEEAVRQQLLKECEFGSRKDKVTEESFGRPESCVLVLKSEIACEERAKASVVSDLIKRYGKVPVVLQTAHVHGRVVQGGHLTKKER